MIILDEVDGALESESEVGIRFDILPIGSDKKSIRLYLPRAKTLREEIK